MKCTIKIFLICQLEWHSRREGGGGVEEEEREGGGGGGGWMGEFMSISVGADYLINLVWSGPSTVWYRLVQSST